MVIDKCIVLEIVSTVDSGGAGGARAPLKFVGSKKGQILISAYMSLAITTDTPKFKKLSTALCFKEHRCFLLL